jgi:hypothetical protein
MRKVIKANVERFVVEQGKAAVKVALESIAKFGTHKFVPKAVLVEVQGNREHALRGIV